MRSAILASLGFMVLAACSGGGSTAPAPPPCGGTVVDAQARLVSPAPGATGVSPSIGAISFSYSNPSTTSAFFVLTPSDGTAAVAAGSATSVAILPGLWTLAIPALKPATTYTVTGSTPNVVNVSCYITVTANLGSFTTR